MILACIASLILSLSPSEACRRAGELFAEDRYAETVDVLAEAVPQIRKSGDDDALAEALSLLSSAYFRLGAFNLALAAQRECYELDLAGGDAGNISSSLNNLAATCMVMKDYAQAEELILDAIHYEEPLGPSAALAVRYGMACDILVKEGKLPEAISYAERALAMDQDAGRSYQAAVRRSQLATAFLESGRLEEAWNCLEEAAPVFESAHNLHSLSVCRQQQGSISVRRGDFQQAARYLREALALSRQTGNKLLQKNISQDLADVLKDTDPRAAMGYMADVAAFTDSIYREETARQISELNLQYGLAGKEQQIVLQRRQLRSHAFLFALLLLLVVLMAVVIVVQSRLSTARQKNNLMLRKASELKDKLLALNGGVTAEPERAGEVSSLVQELAHIGEAPDVQLTNRELEIASLCCQGLISKEIADRLDISQRTVETHKGNIFRKLGINTTLELVHLMGSRNGH